MWNPFSINAPREIGFPYRTGLVHSVEELVDKINKYNCKTTIFTSLYCFSEVNETKTRGIYSSAIIDKLYFDSDKQTLEPIIALHNFCEKHDYLHCMLFSGGGFHFYVGCSGNVKNKNGAVSNAEHYIVKQLKLRIGTEETSDFDGVTTGTGNIAQMVRVPNTFNLKRKLFCIPITKQDLYTSVEAIKQKAQTPQYPIIIYGHKYFDLTPYDSEPIYRMETKVTIEDGEIGTDKINIDTFPVCIKNLLSEKNIKHKPRYILLLYLRELGLPLSDTINLLKQSLDSRTFNHCVREERQPYWVYKRTDMNFPSCQTLKDWGFCKSETCKGSGLYESTNITIPG